MMNKIPEKNEFFENLKASLVMAIDFAAGKREDLRTTTLRRPPTDANIPVQSRDVRVAESKQNIDS